MLECDDVLYPISPQAYRALHRLRDDHEPRRIWIDAVCINQHDEREKSHQVSKMCSIYQYARKVAVYLGETHSEGARLLLEIMRDYVKAQGLDDMLACDRIDRLRYDQTGDFCACHSSMILDGLTEIASPKWFSRIWIKQEIWAATSVQVYFGNATFPWEVMDVSQFILSDILQHMPLQHREIAADWLTQLRNKVRPLRSGTSEDHESVRRKGTQNPFLDLENHTDIISVMIANKSNAAECTDPRDRIYALLGMSTIALVGRREYLSLCSFSIDYDEPVAETFRRLAEHIILRDNSLFLLFLRGAFSRQGESCIVDGNYLPSWVPDWREMLGPTLRPREKARKLLQSSMKASSLCIHRNVLGTRCRRLGKLNFQLQVDHNDQASTDLLKSALARMKFSSGARAMDDVVLLEHTHIPVVLRPRGQGAGTYSYVGPMDYPNRLLGSYDVDDEFEVCLTQISAA